MGNCTFTRGRTTLPGDVEEDVYKRFRIVRGTLAASTSYATGGDTVLLNGIGLSEIRHVLIDHTVTGGLSGITGASVLFDLTNPLVPKMQVFLSTATEAGAATNQSGVSAGCWLLGF